jgi:hypothetical protein
MDTQHTKTAADKAPDCDGHEPWDQTQPDVFVITERRNKANHARDQRDHGKPTSDLQIHVGSRPP